MKENKKKFNIIFPFCGPTVGGSHHSSITLIKKIQNKYNVHIIINSDGQIKDFLKYKNMKFKYIKYPAYQIGENIFKFLIKLPVLLIYLIYFNFKYRPNIIHINDTRTLYTWFFFIFFKKKILFHHRNFLPKSKLVKFLLKKIQIVSISKFLCKDLPEENRSYVVYNPVEISDIKYETKKNNSILTLGFFGSFHYRKNPNIFIEMAFLLKKELKIKCYMVGRISDMEKNNIETFINIKGLSNSIEIIPFLNDPYQIMKTCNFVICPSVNEPFGRVAMEAALLKVPVIAADSGGFKETIKNNFNGFLIEDNLPISYKNKITFLINNKNILKTNVENAYLDVKNKYNSAFHSNQILEIYKKLI
jgi:L-malate glycosyltransferase